MNRLDHAIRKYFVPTEHNEMLPVGLGREAFFLYFLLALVLILSPVYVRISELASLGSPDIVDAQAWTLVGLANQARMAAGLPVLIENSKLAYAASLKVDDMFAKQYFAHFSPVDNTSPWDFFRAADYRYYAAGENLAVDFVTAEEAHTALMNSPTHRANIMSPLFMEIGISVKQGTWSGHSSIMIAQYFGKERVVAPVAAQVAPVAPTPTLTPVPAPVPVVPLPPPIAAQPAPAQVLGTEKETAPPPEPTLPVVSEVKPPVVSNIEPLPVPEPTPPAASAIFAPPVSTFGAIFTAQNTIKLLSLLAILSILLSLMFLMTRGERVTVPTVMRILVLIVLFSYISIFGVGEFSMSAIPSTPAASVVIGG